MRITGGSARGRVIRMADQGVVRPTSDKMRQALYNMLAHSPWVMQSGFDLDGARVFDGFCGTGALGLEALSRGAVHCVFVDYDGRVLQTAKDNAKTCGFTPHASFILKGCQNLGPRPANIEPVNLVLLDPPYGKDLVAPALAALHEGGWCVAGCLCVAETATGDVVDAPSFFQFLNARDYGDSRLSMWQYKP